MGERHQFRGRSYRCLMVNTKSVLDALRKLSMIIANNCLPFMIVGVLPLHPLAIFNLASFNTSLAWSPPFCIMAINALASFTSIELNLLSPEVANTPSMSGDILNVGAIHAIRCGDDVWSYLWLPEFQLMYFGPIGNGDLISFFSWNLGWAVSDGWNGCFTDGWSWFMFLFGIFFLYPLHSFLSRLNLSIGVFTLSPGIFFFFVHLPFFPCNLTGIT